MSMTLINSKLFNIALAIAFCGFLTMTAQADVVVVDEMFTHVDGDLVGQTPTPGPGGTWAAHSGGTTNAIQVSSGEAVVSGTGQDANTNFGARTKGFVSYAFDFLIDDLGTPLTDTDYFASFGASGFATSLPGRLYLLPPAAGRDFGIGVRTSSSGNIAVWGSDFSFLTSISVVVKYQLSNNQAFLSVDGGLAIAGDAHGAGSTSIDDFSFRQTTTNDSEVKRVDNLLVTVPEPSAGLVSLLGLAGICLNRRRKK